jgi:hypothetical protein
MSWTVELATFENMMSSTYLCIAIFIAIYVAEIAIIAVELGFSKRLTYYWMVGFIITVIGIVLVNWGIAIYTHRETVPPVEGVGEVTNVVIDPAFAVFFVIILFGFIMCLVTAMLIVRRYMDELRVFREAEEKKSRAEEVKSEVIARRGRVHGDSETIKDVKAESEEYMKRHEEIRSRW